MTSEAAAGTIVGRRVVGDGSAAHVTATGTLVRPARPRPSTRALPDKLLRFWHSYLIIGFAATAAACLAMLGYLHETPAGPNRTALFAMALAFIAASVLGLVLSRWFAERTWRTRLTWSWGTLSVAAVAVGAYLDTGVASPLMLLIVLPVVYLAATLRAPGIALCGGLTLASIVAVWLANPHAAAARPTALMLLALVAGVAALATSTAIQRGRLQTHDDALAGELHRRDGVDQLTGCWNQTTLDVRLREAVDDALRDGNTLSLVVCDIDLFKTFNDTHGHAAADAMLARVGASIRSAVRAGDIVARVGGDEFAVLMPGAAAAEAAEIAERLLAHWRVAPDPAVTLSAGVAELVAADPRPTRLFRDADSALYDAKESGRDTVGTSAHRIAGANRIAARDEGLDAQQRNDLTRADHKRAASELFRARQAASDAESILDELVHDAPVGLGFIDNDYRVVRCNSAVAAMFGYTPDNAVGHTLPDLLPDLWPNLRPLYERVVTAHEAVVGIAFRGPTVDDPTDLRDWLVSLYPLRLDNRVIGIGTVALDISDRRRLERAGFALADAVVSALAATSEARDPYTAGHQRRVSEIAVAIATELGCDDDTKRGIGLAAAIHDIGKVAVPAEILSRPGKINDAEMQLIRTHSIAGYDILSGLEFPWPVAHMVRQHHERMDGSGYPDHLRGDQITFGARVIAVADVVEAMAAPRPYRESLGLDKALATVEEGSGTIFDPVVVDACLRLFRHGPLTEHLAGLLGQPTADRHTQLVGSSP